MIKRKFFISKLKPVTIDDEDYLEVDEKYPESFRSMDEVLESEHFVRRWSILAKEPWPEWASNWKSYIRGILNLYICGMIVQQIMHERTIFIITMEAEEVD